MRKFRIYNLKSQEQIIEINEADGSMNEFIEIEAEQIGDKYHTMHELYEHRMALTIALFHSLRDLGGFKGYRVVKSLLHNDGTMFEGGYFVVMAIIPAGQISYHYKIKHWDKFKIDIIDRAFPYDGHSSLDVFERLMKL